MRGGTAPQMGEVIKVSSKASWGWRWIYMCVRLDFRTLAHQSSCIMRGVRTGCVTLVRRFTRKHFYISDWVAQSDTSHTNHPRTQLDLCAMLSHAQATFAKLNAHCATLSSAPRHAKAILRVCPPRGPCCVYVWWPLLLVYIYTITHCFASSWSAKAGPRCVQMACRRFVTP